MTYSGTSPSSINPPGPGLNNGASSIYFFGRKTCRNPRDRFKEIYTKFLKYTNIVLSRSVISIVDIIAFSYTLLKIYHITFSLSMKKMHISTCTLALLPIICLFSFG